MNGMHTMSKELPDTINVETGRLNLALRDVLTELRVRTSVESHPSDTVITINRTPEGDMSCASLPPEGACHHDPRLVSLSYMVAAGINAVGNVSVRLRLEDEEAVFVSVWTEP